jgi:uncharacterized protein YkwD
MFAWIKKHIVYHIRNTPLHPLQKVAVFLLSLLLLISFVQSVITPSTQLLTEEMLSAVLPSVIVDLTNTERTSQKIPLLTRSTLLDEAARLKAEDMKKFDYFAHYSPQGVSPWHWFDAVHYNYLYAGENLAVYFDDSEEVVEGWMDSPLHKENILKTEYTEIGVAVVEGKHDGYSTYFVVQLFGTPEKKAVTPPLASQTNTPAPTPPSPVNTVLGETIALTEPAPEVKPTEDSTLRIPELQQENPLPQEAVQVDTVQDTTVQRVLIEESTVYLSDHLSTSSNEALTTENMTQDTSSTLGATTYTHTVLQILFVLISFLILFLSLLSVFLAEKHVRHTQTMYGLGILIVTLVLIFLESHIAKSTIF